MRVVATGGLVASAQDSAANKPFTPDGIGSTHTSVRQYLDRCRSARMFGFLTHSAVFRGVRQVLHRRTFGFLLALHQPCFKGQDD